MNVRYIVELTDGERVTLQQCLAGGKERTGTSRYDDGVSSPSSRRSSMDRPARLQGRGSLSRFWQRRHPCLPQ